MSRIFLTRVKIYFKDCPFLQLLAAASKISQNKSGPHSRVKWWSKYVYS